eukprot:scaffold878_cov271-Pinguiococcus_pyrenoidosus.AAC.59
MDELSRWPVAASGWGCVRPNGAYDASRRCSRIVTILCDPGIPGFETGPSPMMSCQTYGAANLNRRQVALARALSCSPAGCKAG